MSAVRARARHDQLEHQHREQRAERIDDDPLPAQDVADALVRPHAAQHRHDDRRPGDGDHRAEQQRDRPVEARQGVPGPGEGQIL